MNRIWTAFLAIAVLALSATAQEINRPGVNLWTLTGTDIYYSAGDVGIGVNPPTARLDVGGQSLTGSEDDSLLNLATTWNTTGVPTAIKLDVTDTASGSGALLMDLDGKVTVAKNGLLNASFATVGGPGVNGSAISYYHGGLSMGSVGYVSWSSSGPSATGDTRLYRDGPGILAQRNGTAAQEQRWANNDDGAGNAEWVEIGFQDTTNTAVIKTNASGTGTVRNLELLSGGPLVFGANQIQQWTINTSGHLYPESSNNRDIGRVSNKMRNGYFGTSVETPALNASGDPLEIGGSVGIGTSSPSSKLHVYGATGAQSIYVESDDAAAQVILDGGLTANGTLGQISFQNQTDSIASVLARRASANDAGDLAFYTQPTGGAITERMTILSTGEVGIGDPTPDAKLDVATPASGAAIAVGRVTGQPSIVAGSDASTGHLVMDSASGGIVYLNLYNNGDTNLVAGGGDVMIGATSPANARLDVRQGTNSSSQSMLEIRDTASAGSAGAFVFTDATSNPTGFYPIMRMISESGTGQPGATIRAQVDQLTAAHTGITIGISNQDSSGSISPADDATLISIEDHTTERFEFMGDGRMVITDITSSPPTTPTGGAAIYSNAGEMTVMDDAGNATPISPHPTEVMEVMGMTGAAKTLGMDYTVPNEGLAVAQPKARWLEWYVEIDHETGEWTKRNFTGEEIENGQSNELKR